MWGSGNQFAGRVFNWIICFVLSYQFLLFLYYRNCDRRFHHIQLATRVVGCAGKYAIVFSFPIVRFPLRRFAMHNAPQRKREAAGEGEQTEEQKTENHPVAL